MRPCKCNVVQCSRVMYLEISIAECVSLIANQLIGICFLRARFAIVQIAYSYKSKTKKIIVTDVFCFNQHRGS